MISAEVLCEACGTGAGTFGTDLPSAPRMVTRSGLSQQVGGQCSVRTEQVSETGKQEEAGIEPPLKGIEPALKGVDLGSGGTGCWPCDRPSRRTSADLGGVSCVQVADSSGKLYLVQCTRKRLRRRQPICRRAIARDRRLAAWLSEPGAAGRRRRRLGNKTGPD